MKEKITIVQNWYGILKCYTETNTLYPLYTIKQKELDEMAFGC